MTTPEPLTPFKTRFSTRTLLLITAWAALCYAMMFTTQSLIFFQAARLVGILVVVVSTVLPFVVPFKNQKFWNAYAVSTIGLLCVSVVNDFGNPIAAGVTQLISMAMEQSGGLDPGMQSINYVEGVIGRFAAIYHCVEIHVIVILGLLFGALWHHLKEQTPFWIVGVWVFLIALDLNSIQGLSPGFFSSLAIVAVLPSFSNYHGKWHAFWIAFGVSGFVAMLQLLTTRNYEFADYVNSIVANWYPTVSGRIGESIAYAGIPIVALAVGLLVQLLASRIVASSVAIEDEETHPD